MRPKQRVGKVKGIRREGTLIHSLEKRLREREREKVKTTQEGLGPLIY